MNKSLILFIFGLGLLMYGSYIPAKALFAQYLIHAAWQTSYTQNQPMKPWPWADTHAVMRLVSEKHHQDLIVLSGDTGNVLAFGPGHNLQSGYLGENSTIMISAHRDTHFKFLQQVEIGDEFDLYGIEQHQRTYIVTERKIIDTRYDDLLLSDNQETLMLVTCYPFNNLVVGGPLRYVVTAEKR